MTPKASKEEIRIRAVGAVVVAVISALGAHFGPQALGKLREERVQAQIPAGIVELIEKKANASEITELKEKNVAIWNTLAPTATLATRHDALLPTLDRRLERIENSVEKQTEKLDQLLRRV